MFHAVSALLLLDGKRYNKHSGVITAFGRDYAKIGLVPKEYAELLNKAYDVRNKAEYDVDMVIDEKMAELYYQKAEELVAFIEKMVAEKLAEDKPTS